MSRADSEPTRRRSERKPPAARAAEIRAVARAIALDDGLAAVTLRAVAARAGVTPALVAHYEPSMDDLVAATFSAVVAREVEEIRVLLAAHRAPVERVRALIGTLLDSTRHDVTAVWVDAWSMGRRSEALAAAARTQMDAWQEFVLAEIEAGIEQGAFATDDADAVAWQFIGMVDGLNAQSLVHYRDAGSRGRLLAHALEQELGLSRGALA